MWLKLGIKKHAGARTDQSAKGLTDRKLVGRSFCLEQRSNAYKVRQTYVADYSHRFAFWWWCSQWRRRWKRSPLECRQTPPEHSSSDQRRWV